MKLYTKIALVLTLICLSITANAQFSAGAQYSRLSWSGDTDITNSGFGLVAGYYFRDRIDLNLAANFYGKGDVTIGSTKLEVSAFVIDAGVNYYVLGRPQETNAGLYGIAGLSFANVKRKISTTGLDDFEDSGLQTNLVLGAGARWRFLFLNWKINLAANEQNGEQVAVQFGNFSTLNVGAKFDIGGGNKYGGRRKYKRKKRRRRRRY